MIALNIHFCYCTIFILFKKARCIIVYIFPYTLSYVASYGQEREFVGEIERDDGVIRQNIRDSVHNSLHVA